MTTSCLTVYRRALQQSSPHPFRPSTVQLQSSVATDDLSNCQRDTTMDTAGFKQHLLIMTCQMKLNTCVMSQATNDIKAA